VRIVAANIVEFTGYSAVNLLVPLVVASGGGSPAAVGWATGAYGLLPFFFAIPLGRLMDRVGARWVGAVGLVGAALSTAALVNQHGLWLIVAFQAFRGLGQLGYVLGVQDLVARAESGPNRAVNMSRQVGSAAFGQFLGPLLGAWLAARLGYADAYWVAAVLTLIPVVGLVPVALSSVVAAGAQGGGERRKVVGSGDPPPSLLLIIVTSALTILTTSLVNSFLPVVLKDEGVALVVIGLVVSLRSVAQAAVGVSMGLLQRLVRGVPLIWICTGAGAVAMLLVPATGSIWLIGLLVAVVGFSRGVNAAITLALMADASRGVRQGFLLGLRVSANRLGQLVGPAGLGMLGALWGYDSIFWIDGVVMLAVVATWPLWDAASRGVAHRPPVGAETR
jgi:MFS family permease